MTFKNNSVILNIFQWSQSTKRGQWWVNQVNLAKVIIVGLYILFYFLNYFDNFKYIFSFKNFVEANLC